MSVFDNLREGVNAFIDWSADKVKTFTGEKERRQRVSQIKSLYLEFKNTVERLVDELNQAIRIFNVKIGRLNNTRQNAVASNIQALYGWLSNFGNVKESSVYCAESEKPIAALPEQEFERHEDYIRDIDWSKDEVFNNTFFTTIFGTKVKTRKQNLSMLEHIHEFQLTASETVKQLEGRVFFTKVEQDICDLYIQCVEFISTCIEEKILPELLLTEAFFQALDIKDKVLARHQIESVDISHNPIIIRDTIYDKHYRFLKNSFVFYVFSCKVYNTPILTRLLNNSVTETDLAQLKDIKSALVNQNAVLDECVLVK